MNTDDIYGHLDCFLKHCTFAVIPCDLLNDLEVKSYPLYLVCNSEQSGDPGKHWLVLFQAFRGGPLLFIDSFGRSIDSYNEAFSKFAKFNSCRVIEGDRILQHLKSDVCGHYSIYFIHKLYRKNGCIGSIYHGFTHDTLRNDRKVVTFVKKLVCNPLKSTAVSQCCTRFCEN